jgi:hypothetical protein
MSIVLQKQAFHKTNAAIILIFFTNNFDQILNYSSRTGANPVIAIYE